MSEHTPEAVRAAARIADIDWIQTGKTEYDKLKLETIIDIIDQETGLPEMKARQNSLRELTRFQQARIDRLEAEKAELVNAHRAISSLHGNMSLDSIEKVNGINDGRDRAIKLRAAMEISRAALAKEPENS